MHSITSWFHMVIIVLTTLFSFHPQTFAENHHPESDNCARAFHDTFTNKIKAICIYMVQNGQLEPRVFTGSDIKKQKTIQINGYITGIVLFTTEHMNILVAGQRMDFVHMNRDGTYELKYFGNLNHQEFLTTLSNSAPLIQDLPALSQTKGKYCYFPKIQGDAVCNQAIFNITLSMGNAMLTLPVNHTGSRKFYDTGSGPIESQNNHYFRDIGNSLGESYKELQDCKQRITALSKGIETAESRFRTKLVDAINILNYNGPDNAFTYKGEKEIWIYKQTFQTVSPQELHSLAEHEACHILVDRVNLTSNSALRKHFADLKGYGTFSPERFTLITRGLIPQKDSTDTSSNSYFFAFIDEKNFIKGMTGGHSQDNLEEFYSSFLHSTLYIDRLYDNLKHPITLPGGRKRLLTKVQQEQTIDTYMSTLELIRAAVQKKTDAKDLSQYLMATTRELVN